MKAYLPLFVAGAVMSTQISAATLSKCTDALGRVTYADSGSDGRCVGFDPTRPGATSTAAVNLQSLASQNLSSKMLAYSSAYQQSAATAKGLVGSGYSASFAPYQLSNPWSLASYSALGAAAAVGGRSSLYQPSLSAQLLSAQYSGRFSAVQPSFGTQVLMPKLPVAAPFGVYQQSAFTQSSFPTTPVTAFQALQSSILSNAWASQSVGKASVYQTLATVKTVAIPAAVAPAVPAAVATPQPVATPAAPVALAATPMVTQPTPAAAVPAAVATAQPAAPVAPTATPTVTQSTPASTTTPAVVAPQTPTVAPATPAVPTGAGTSSQPSTPTNVAQAPQPTLPASPSGSGATTGSGTTNTGGSTNTGGTVTPPPATPTPTPWSACSRFQPGHYVHIADDNTRSLDGLAVLKNRLSKDVRNFKGVAYQMPWGMLEKSAGVYDFSRLDAALAQVKAKGMYLLLKFEERTFWTTCSSNFVPSYVARDGSATDTKYCIAKVWDKTTVDHMIRVLQQIALRYKDDPSFLGIDLEETSIGAKTVQSDKKLYYTYYDQLKRIHTSVHSVAPNLIINQEVNWPVNDDIDAFYAIADNLVKMGGGGAMGWPDSVPSGGNSYRPVWSWYQIGRDYNRKMMILPYVQAANIDSSVATAEKIYNMLNSDIQAHMIVWAQWHADLGDAYFTDVVIPTVNKYKGAVKNNTCPF